MIEEKTATNYGLESEILYQIRPPSGKAPPNQIRRYRYLCYGFENDIYLPRSKVNTFSMTEHRDDRNGIFWELGLNGTSWILPDFDPNISPIDLLNVQEVLDA